MNDAKTRPDSGDIKQTMAKVLGIEVSRLEDDAVLTDLVTSSFLLVEMIIEAQEEYGIRFNQESMRGITKVGELVSLFMQTLDSQT